MTTPGIADRMSRRLDDSPLYQLVKLKLRRILYSASADSEDMDAGIGVALTVLTLPGAFLSLLLFNKYGSLLRFLRGQVRFDPYAASLPDEYLFIVLAMLVSGGVALWKWDTVFPDRRDMFNVVPLPVHIRQIFLGSLLAILLFGAIFCIDVNAASAVLFPLVVSASQESFLFFGKIALGHGLAIVTASLFTFAAVFAIAGVFMAALPARIFHAVSLYIRAAIAITLLVLFSSAFTVSQSVALGTDLRYSLLRYLPSIWFLGTCQWARGVASATFRHFAFTGFIALILTSLLGSLAYGLAYRRHFNRMIELSAKRGGNRSWGISSVVGRILDRTILRTPFEQAAFRFTVRTLAKSDRHRAALAVFAGIGFVAASQYLSLERSRSSRPDDRRVRGTAHRSLLLHSRNSLYLRLAGRTERQLDLSISHSAHTGRMCIAGREGDLPSRPSAHRSCLNIVPVSLGRDFRRSGISAADSVGRRR